MEIVKYEFPKRCHLYSKSFEEIIEAGSKHGREGSGIERNFRKSKN